jgi:hypothetical protein
MQAHMLRVGQNHIYMYMYIQCVYGILGREITKHAVIHGAYKRFWPILHILHFLVVQRCMQLVYIICVCVWVKVYIYTSTHTYIYLNPHIYIP